MEIWPGKPYPLGATYDGTGVNFAIFSEVAEKIELCLIGERGKETRLTLPEVDGFVWHGFLPGVQPGSATATASTARTTRRGVRCNPRKLLLDPTPRPSTARCAATRRCSGTTSTTRTAGSTTSRTPRTASARR
jgi:pullulanase/glycogen debranching enzyme